MSRTDKHRPWWVQLRDPDVVRRCTVWHNHWEHSDPYVVYRAGFRFGILRYHVVRTAPCDLGTEHGIGRCKRWPVWNTCGCRMCTAHHECREERRRSRHEARRHCRNVLKGQADASLNI